MAHKAVEIANAFLAMPEARGRLSQMKLQKLVYLAHAWNLAINGEPLVIEEPEAWDYGPVFRDLYDHTKYFGRGSIDRLLKPEDDVWSSFFVDGDKKEAYQANLSPQENSVLQSVWRRYGGLSALKLSDLTHQPGTPWFVAYENGRDTTIANEIVRAHFLKLARDIEAERGAA